MTRKKAPKEAGPTESQFTRAASQRALRRVVKRGTDGEERLMLSIRSDGPSSSKREPIHGMSNTAMELRLLDAFGTTSPEFVDDMLAGLLTTFQSPTDRRATREVNSALAVLDGMKPENEVEAMLLTQMIATNAAAMNCLAQIKSAATAEAFGNLSVKLLRTFTGQAEALAKLRRGGQQTVKVVHVYPGGQAVVGDVHNHQLPRGEGASLQIEDQSVAAAGKISEGTALPSSDAIGKALPSPRRRRKAPVQDARRD